MKLKKMLSIALAICMLLTLIPVTPALATESETAQNETLEFEQLDNSEIHVDLGKDTTHNELQALEQNIDEDEMVKVIIVMEGDSVVESNSTAVMSVETREQMGELDGLQSMVVAAIEEEVLDGEELDVEYNYTWLLNGVAATVPYGTIAEIKAVEGVEKVLLQPVYEVCDAEVADPNTISDGVMIGRDSAWTAGYTGKGMKIAIIDTGLDIDHQNFAALSEDKLSEDPADADTVAAVIGSLKASQRYDGLTAADVYYNTKVAFGFNYCDDNLNITHDADTQGDHGTHVAGIAAANKVEGSDVVGVAPDAQLYIMKVFGFNGGAYAADILAALEDALMLGADVINMSLGSPAGFTSSVDEINAIYDSVAETNSVLSVSAGNSYTSAYGNLWGTNQNQTIYPDNSVIGSPAIYENVLSIASVENWKVQRNYIQVSDGYKMSFVETSASYGIPSVLTLDGEYEIVVVPGTGTTEDFAGLDVKGKIALVQRGVIDFGTKCNNAAAAGAIACIVYNNVSGEFGMDLTDSGVTIPSISITMADGEYLIAKQQENGALTISFPEEPVPMPSATAYQMSDFSSWGATPELGLEPDITAPGGNIYSTVDDGQYGLMSGTSMAAPNVSGIAAVVMQYVEENFEGEDCRTLVQHLLTSTAMPLVYENEAYYSPRSQGSGLANAYNAIKAEAYLTVEGMDVPKVELGEDAAKTGTYSYSFDVHNFGESTAYYELSTTVQTEGVVNYGTEEEPLYFMSGTPQVLTANAVEASADVTLLHDVDIDMDTDAYDAYLIYRAAAANTEILSSESFRYELDGTEGISTGDVQEYLNALVGLESEADLESKVLQVAAGATAEIQVSVALSDEDKAYFAECYPNGGYVEGFTVLEALYEGGVDLSLPYMGFYGDWAAAPVLDNGNYWDALNLEEDDPTVVGNQYLHILSTNLAGEASAFYPGVNFYVDEVVDPAHISVSPNGDGFIDTVDDIYTSLLRNAQTLTYRYTNMADGTVYYDETLEQVSKTVYSLAHGQIVPTVYSWFEEEIGLWDWKDKNGNDLPNNTQVLLEVVATGVDEGDAPEVWAVPITVDLEAPSLQSVQRVVDEETGKVTLELAFCDNFSASVVALMNSNGNQIYYMDPVADVEPDENGYQNYTVSYDITNLSGKLVIVLSDYALNEAYYALNLGGAGAPYGELVAYQYNFETSTNGWVSFNTAAPENEEQQISEVQISMGGANGMDIVSAEYVAGYVFAQTEDGKLYGFRYEDMLADTFDIASTYITTLENVYQDMAYSYREGKLYGLLTYEEAGYPNVEIFSINLKGEYYDPDMWTNVAAYQEDPMVQRGGLYGLAMAIDDEGTIYVLGNSATGTYNENDEYVVVYDETASLWSVGMEYDEWSDSYMLGYQLTEVGNTGLSMDYLQSMTWDHNTESLYWARFDADQLNIVSELYCMNPATAEATKIGNLSGETCALFAPLSENAAAKEEHANIPEIDPAVIGTPVLRDDVVTMNVGGTRTLIYDLDPWYTNHKAVVWSTSDSNVVTVDENGVITAVNAGSATITAANAADETKMDTVTVEVTALDLKLEGVVSAQTAGLGNVTGVSTYAFEMVDGVSSFGTVNAITVPDELNYGLSLAASEMGRGSLWACEYGNTGIIYEIDPATGVVKDALQPIDGDMLFGMSYSESQDTFAAIMNMYLFVDLELTHEEQEVMMGTYDEELKQYTYHRVNLLPYLIEAGEGFVTGETGQGASSEVVFCGVTTIEDSYIFQDTYKDYLGNWMYDGSTVNYISDQTLVLLDNVGRLWYIDEIVGMTKSADDLGNAEYTDAKGSYITSVGALRNGMFEMEVVDETGNVTYNVFNIRKIEETPLTDMFREGSMPRYTYHFSDIEYAGKTADGAPMFALSLYDYWNNGTTNELYLYVHGVGTGEWVMDYETWESYEVMTPSRFYTLGNTGEYNIIASIHTAQVTGGVDAEPAQNAVINPLAASFYRGGNVTE